MKTAHLVLAKTSAECVCYRLMVDYKVIWRTRAFDALPESHAGARARMAAWALKHGVKVVEAQPAAPRPKQAIIAGRYGRS